MRDGSSDISESMRERVANGYGFDPAKNAKLLKDDDVILQRVWEWLSCIQTLSLITHFPSSCHLHVYTCSMTLHVRDF